MDVGDLNAAAAAAAAAAGSGGAATAAILGPPGAGILSVAGGGGSGGGGATATIIPTTATSAGWWTPTSTIVTAPANTDVMNQLCRVCGEPAAGFHFGAFTCEGCKSFFGRTYNNLGSISECKNGGACVINKKNRTACKACRLRKCLMVGMSKSGSRYGRRSNWFKIHCLLQEQTHQAQAQRLKVDPKTQQFDKVLSSLDAANNNSSGNNNGGPDVRTSGQHLANHQATSGNNAYQPGRMAKVDDPRLRPRDLASLRIQRDSSQRRGHHQTEVIASRPSTTDLGPHPQHPHELLRPDASRFPVWRGPPFFHPALSPMHLLNSPFFPFQHRFVVPYVGQIGPPQIPVTSLSSSSSSSSESVSPRSTPSPKVDADRAEVEGDVEAQHRDKPSRSSRLDVGGALQGSETRTSASQEKSLAFLRSLGPEQDEPMDLSARNSATLKRRTDGRTTGQSASSEDETTDGRTEAVGGGGSDAEDDGDEDMETGPPLDLTRKT